MSYALPAFAVPSPPGEQMPPHLASERTHHVADVTAGDLGYATRIASTRGHEYVSADKVILRGTVRSWAEREAAQRADWSAPGVTAVENLITVVL